MTRWVAVAAVAAAAGLAGITAVSAETPRAARATSPPADLPAGKVRQRLQSWRANVRDGSHVPRAERERLRRGITRYMPAGVTLELLQFIGGPKDGVLVRMTTATPAGTLQALEPVVSYVVRAGALGAFQLKDASGGTVWVAGHLRNGGFVWTRPDLDACSPIAHGGGGPSTCPGDG